MGQFSPDPVLAELDGIRGGDTYCAVPYPTNGSCVGCVKGAQNMSGIDPYGMEYSYPVWYGCKETLGDDYCMTSAAFTDTRCFKVDTDCGGLRARFRDQGCTSLDQTFIDLCTNTYRKAQSTYAPGVNCENVVFGLY